MYYLILFLPIVVFYAEDVILLQPDFPYVNQTILLSPDSTRFYKVKDPQPNTCYEFYPSFPAAVCILHLSINIQLSNSFLPIFTAYSSILQISLQL